MCRRTRRQWRGFDLPPKPGIHWRDRLEFGISPDRVDGRGATESEPPTKRATKDYLRRVDKTDTPALENDPLRTIARAERLPVLRLSRVMLALPASLSR